MNGDSRQAHKGAAGGPGSLRRSAAAGVKWTMGAAGVTAVTQFVQITVVAQFLSPADLGLAAIVIVVVGIASRLADFGLSNAIIAKQASGDELSSLYWLNVIAGVTLAVAVVAASPLIADIYGQPELEPLLRIAALAFLITPFGQQFQALLQRDLTFAPLAMAEAVAAIAGATLAIGLAATGTGAAALAWGLVVTAAVRAGWLAVLGWRRWRPKARFRRAEVRNFVGFGAYQTGAGLVIYTATNVDYLLIGYFLGPAALGAYTLAYQIVVRPQVQLNPILNRIAFPVFARRQTDDAALRRGFVELSRTLAMVSFPFLIGAIVVAPDLVPALFGNEWSEAVGLLQILALLGILKALGNPQGSIYLAKVRPDLQFRNSVGLLVLVVVAILAGVQAGVAAAAAAHVVAVLINFGVNRWRIQQLIGLGVRDYLASLWRPAVLAGTMGLVVLCATPLIHRVADTDLVTLLVQVVVGATTYGLLLAIFDRAEIIRLWRLLRVRQGAEPGSVLRPMSTSES